MPGLPPSELGGGEFSGGQIDQNLFQAPKKIFVIPRLQRQSRCAIITSIRGAAPMKRWIGHLFNLDNIWKSGFCLCILLGWLHVFPRGKSCT